MSNFLSLSVSIAGEELILDPDRALYWPAEQTLFVTDLHLGKVAHFHKEGIAIPGEVVKDDYDRLHRLMQRYCITHWVCLGDLFHSHLNQEYPLFLEWRAKYSHLKLTLIEGNHDRYMRKYYHEMDLNIYPELDLKPFYLVHEWKQETPVKDRYALSGHLHPHVKLHGKARQVLKLPCFWFQETGGYLPAFGQFTGSPLIHPQEKDKVYVTTSSQVIKIN